MGWEQRGNRRFYYRAVRVNGQPRKRYLGTGAVGEAHARLDARERRVRAAERRARNSEQARWAIADAALDELRAMTELIAGATLLLAGFHLHRGEWRRRDVRTSQFERGRGEPPR
jgi:hypothetical protein